MRKFLTLSGKCEGFQRKNITPYIHILVYHIPPFIQRFGSVKNFSGQGKKWSCLCLHVHNINFSALPFFKVLRKITMTPGGITIAATDGMEQQKY